MYSIVAAVSVVCIVLIPSLAAEECIPSSNTEYSSCACQLKSTEEYINLSPLLNSTVVPRFTIAMTNYSGKGEEGWKFSYNPCKSFSMFLEANLTSSCRNVAAARWTSPPQAPIRSVCQDLGEQESVKYDTKYYDLSPYELESSNVTLVFSTSNEPKLNNRAIIHLVCSANTTKEDSTFHFLKEDHSDLNDYYFALESPCGCPGLCGNPPAPEPTSSPKPSTGDGDDKWLIIGVSIGAVLLLLLIILAVVCCRKRRQGYASV